MTHLHTRSMYSLLESPFRPERIVAASCAAGMQSAALTDLNVMHGAAAFAGLCRKAGLKPVLGMETVADGLRLLLLARNDAGLQELYRLSTRLQTAPAGLEGILSSCENCFVIALGIDDALDQAIQQEDREKALSLLQKLPDNGSVFLAEAMMDSSLRRSRQAFLASMPLPLAAISYVLYEKEADVEVLQVLKAVQQNTTAEQAAAGIIWHRQFYSPDEMESLYSPESLEAAAWIESQVDADPQRLPKNTLPAYQNRAGVSSAQWLEALARKGLDRRLKGNVPPVYRQRLDYELSVIHSMGFDDYFLVVQDMIRWAIQNGILTGPGRGSAAGSLVAWVLGITQLDPVRCGLLFERFLNPARISMPDIDTDFPDDRRQDVIAHLQEQYGACHAVQIIAFSNFKARQALRDSAKALGFPDRTADQLTRLIPNKPGISLDWAWNSLPGYQKRIRENRNLQKIHAMALRLEGLPRHASIHAAGVVLAREEVQTVCPLAKLDDVWATQFPAEQLEQYGLIKMDVLSLRNLTIIRQVLDRLEARGIHYDPWKMAVDDPKTYGLLSRGDTIGVFQLEKEGMRQLLRNMRPSSFADVATALALYRPGPMEQIPVYLDNRAHPERIRFLHPMLEPILKETAGIFIYQEQIMETAVQMGGFTLPEADLLRKAMSKKHKEEMLRFKEKFLAGARNKGVEEETAGSVFSLMERFAEYGFNKSHAYAYGLVTYVMAFLKANHPVEFYLSLMNGSLGSEARTSQYIQECRSKGLPVLPVDLRFSGREWQLEPDGLRMPLSLLKGLGSAAVSRIVAMPEKSADPILVITALWAEKLTEKQIQVLAGSGALDYTGYNRATLLDNIPRILNYAHIVKVENQDRLFDFSIASVPTLVRVKENRLEKSRLEKEAFGFYVSEHPVAALRSRYAGTVPLSEAGKRPGYVEVLGRVLSIRTGKTKKGDPMAFVVLEDESGQGEFTVFPDLYRSQRDRLANGSLLHVRGRKSPQYDSISISRMDVIPLDQ